MIYLFEHVHRVSNIIFVFTYHGVSHSGNQRGSTVNCKKTPTPKTNQKNTEMITLFMLLVHLASHVHCRLSLCFSSWKKWPFLSVLETPQQTSRSENNEGAPSWSSKRDVHTRILSLFILTFLFVCPLERMKRPFFLSEPKRRNRLLFQRTPKGQPSW